MTNGIDTDLYQYNQVCNNLFYSGIEPEQDNRFPCYRFTLYLFYKSNLNISINIDNMLQNNWTSTGSWYLRDYKVIQFNGPAPMCSISLNESIIRSEMDRLLNINSIQEYKIRSRYPDLPPS